MNNTADINIKYYLHIAKYYFKKYFIIVYYP